MRYPFSDGGKGKKLAVELPFLLSGLEQCRFCGSENRMADCRNLWWEKNALRTRPGLRGSAETRWMTEEPLQYFQESVIFLLMWMTAGKDGWGIRVEGADMRFQVDVILPMRTVCPFGWGTVCRCILFSQKPTAMAIPYTAESLLLLISDGSYYWPPETPLSETWSSLGPEVYYPLAMTDGHGSATPDRSKVTYKAEES